MTFSNQIKTLKSVALLAVCVSVMTACSVDNKRGASPTPGDQLDYKMESGTNFRLDALKVDSSFNVTYQSNGAVNQKLFNFSTCLKDMGGNAALPDLNVSIKDNADGEIVRPTDRNGCIQWSEIYQLNALENDTFFTFKRTIAPQSTYRGEVYVEAALNPWLDGGAALIDTRKTVLPDSIKVIDAGPFRMRGQNVRGKTDSNSLGRIYVDSINFQAMGLDFENFKVNKFLGLTVAQKYRVRLKPSLVRKSLTTETDMKVINKGRMRVVLSLFKDIGSYKNLDPKNLITTTEFVGDIIYGTVTADIDLNLENVSAILSRSQVLVTLEPMDELATVGPSSFVGPSNPGILSAVSLVPSEGNARDLSVAAARAKSSDLTTREKTNAQKLMFANEGMSLVDSSGEIEFETGWFSPNKKMSFKEALEGFIWGRLTADQKDQLLTEMCRKSFGRGAGGLVCTNPTKMVFLTKRDFVEQVNKAPKMIGQTNKETMTFTTNVSYSLAESEGRTDSTKWGWSAGLGLDIGSSWPPEPGSFLGPAETTPPAPKNLLLSFFSLKGTLGLKWGMGQDWFETTAVSKTSTSSIGTTATKSIDVISNTFLIDVNFRPCLIFGAQGKYEKQTNGKKYMYCSDKPYRKEAMETYYLLNEVVGNDSTGFSDSGMPGASPWRMFIRGPKAYLYFSKMIQSLKENNLVLEKLPESSKLKGVMSAFPEFYMVQDYPGVLTPQ